MASGSSSGPGWGRGAVSTRVGAGDVRGPRRRRPLRVVRHAREHRDGALAGGVVGQALLLEVGDSLRDDAPGHEVGDDRFAGEAPPRRRRRAPAPPSRGRASRRPARARHRTPPAPRTASRGSSPRCPRPSGRWGCRARSTGVAQPPAACAAPRSAPASTGRPPRPGPRPARRARPSWSRWRRGGPLTGGRPTKPLQRSNISSTVSTRIAPHALRAAS